MRVSCQGICDDIEHFSADDKSSVIKLFYNVFRNNDKCLFSELLEELDRDYSIDWKKFLVSSELDFFVGFSKEESAIEKLFKKLQYNNNVDEIVPKVAIINQLYSAGLNGAIGSKNFSVVEMSERIAIIGKQIDSFCEGDDLFKLFDALADASINNFTGYRKNNTPSFASKYLSFSLGVKGIDAVPITDTYSRLALSKIQKNCNVTSLLNYKCFYKEICKLKESLSNVTFKELDVFLWIIGKAFAKKILVDLMI